MAVIEMLVSGGQTGADIAALDVALRFGFLHGGWCPKGRRSLEDPIPIRYLLKESKEPGIHAWVMEVLEQAFFHDRVQPGVLGGPGEG